MTTTAHVQGVFKTVPTPTDKDDIKAIHQMVGSGVDGNANATDEEIIDAINSFLGGGE